MTVALSVAARVADTDDQVYDLLKRHGAAIRALEFGQVYDLALPGHGDSHAERLVTRRESYTAVVLLVRDLHDSGTKLAILPTSDGLRLLRLGKPTR